MSGKILIHVEGQTEEAFIRDVLGPYFEGKGISFVPILVKTKVTRSGKSFKGGIVSYERVRKEIRNLLADSSAAAVTTMYDLYALPDDFPGPECWTISNPRTKVVCLEEAFARDIGSPRFVPFFTLHEFEALVLSDPRVLVAALGENEKHPLVGEVEAFASPEEIDLTKDGHPAARIERYFPSYGKILDGVRVAKQIGIDRIRIACPHFDAWLERLSSFGELVSS